MTVTQLEWMKYVLSIYVTIYMFLLVLILDLLNPDIPYPAFAKSVDPDQLDSEEANWSGSALFAI